MGVIITYKKKNLLVFFLVFFLIGVLSFINAAPINNGLHLNLQVTDTSGNVVPGTYNFVFNISTSNTCTPVVYSNSATLTTDSRGIISYYLQNTNLDFSNQYYLCYYRDGSLINNSEIAMTPYAFRAKYVNLSGVQVDQNFNLSGFNVTSNYFKGSGKYLTNLNVSQIDLSSYFTKSNILGFGYYNSSNFIISDYYLKSNPFNFYNSTTIPSYILTSNEADLNVNSSNYWDGLNTPSDILGSEITNNLNWINASTASGSYIPYFGSNANVVLGNYNFSVGTSKLFVNSNTGSVGIGITNSLSKLGINGGLAVGSYASMLAPINGAVISGKLGVGTASPVANLDVNGSFAIKTTIFSVGVNGDVTVN